MVKQENKHPAAKKSLVRKVLTILGVLICLPPLVLVTFLTIKYHSELINTFDKVSFERQMPVPKLADSTVESDGTRVFNLNVQTGTTQFFDGINTETWGVNGSYLGPTIRAKKGEKVRMNVQNNLPEMTTMHWHGMHVPAQMDGGPHQPVEPGTTWSPNWTINQPAATLWYHPHPHGVTEKHVYRGIAGMFILDDDQQPAGLPNNYGVDDVPVIVQDKKFKDDKQLNLNQHASTGITGSEILVNGARTPHLTVSTERIRLRLLNGSNARIYNFGLANGQDMQLIASDGGLLEKPVTLQKLRLSPGERAEVIVALKPGQQVALRSYPLELGSSFLNDRSIGADDSLEIMQLRAATALAPSAQIPERLVALDRLQETDAKQIRPFKLSGLEINDKKMDINRMDFTVTRGDTEIWEVRNTDASPHNFHIHDVQFQILSLDGKTPPPELQGWKDTLLLLHDQKARLIMKFADYSDPTFPYMYHCHLLRHEDAGMMGQFLVLDPGQVPIVKKHDTAHPHGH